MFNFYIFYFHFFRHRSPSPEIVNEVNPENLIIDSTGELRDVYNLPAPLPRQEIIPRNRIPSPIPGTQEELDLNYVNKSAVLLLFYFIFYFNINH